MLNTFFSVQEFYMYIKIYTYILETSFLCHCAMENVKRKYRCSITDKYIIKNFNVLIIYKSFFFVECMYINCFNKYIKYPNTSPVRPAIRIIPIQRLRQIHRQIV